MGLIKRHATSSKKTGSKELEFTQLMNESMNFAFQIARQFFSETDEIQDAIQNAYIKAWNSFDRYSAQQSLFTTWYYSILRNECIDRLRRRRKYYQEDITSIPNLGNQENFETLESKELHQEIILLADRLSPTQKEIFILRDIQGFSIKEVAKSTGHSEGSIKTSLYLARKKLRIWILEEELI